LADHLSHNHTIPRTSCLLLSATIGIIGISLLLNVTDASKLWVVSALWGVSYGTVFALFPALVLERFGMREFFCRLFAFFHPLNSNHSAFCTKRWFDGYRCGMSLFTTSFIHTDIQKRLCSETSTTIRLGEISITTPDPHHLCP
jgi:hypothetical protein